MHTQWLYTALSRHRDTAHLYASTTTLDDLAADLEAHTPPTDQPGHDTATALASLAVNLGVLELINAPADFGLGERLLSVAPVARSPR